MNRFRDTFDATPRNDKAVRKKFEDLQKLTKAECERGRSFVSVEKKTDKWPKPVVSGPEQATRIE